MRNTRYRHILFLALFMTACGKDKGNNPAPPAPPPSFSLNTLKVNGVYNGYTYKGLGAKPVVKIEFTSALDPASVSGSVTFKSKAGTAVTYSATYENYDSTMVITPS